MSLQLVGSFQCEADLSEAIARAFERDGWQAETERVCRFGRIDVLLKRAADVRIVEVKMQQDWRSVRVALSQLLFYAEAYPDASLWLATPAPPDDASLAALQKHGISFLECEVSGVRAPAPVTKEEAEKFVTPAEASRMRGVTRSAISELIRRGRLRTEILYGVRLVYRADVENFQRAKPTKKAKAATKTASKKGKTKKTTGKK
jgi:hypothetical protein